MKKIGIALMMIFAIVATVYAADNTEAKIKFEKTTHDFGNIKSDGGPVSVTFKFTNEGNEALHITSATAQCGCTKPQFPDKAIKPGETGEIKVSFNPKGYSGGFTKVVTVRCSGNPGKVNLKIRGSVIPQ